MTWKPTRRELLWGAGGAGLAAAGAAILWPRSVTVPRPAQQIPLPRVSPEQIGIDSRRQHAPLQRFLDGAVRDTTLSFWPGTNLQYQSMGTAVVAEIVQRLSGKAIADFLRVEIFEPLGLRSTALGSRGFDPQRLVHV